MGPDPLSTCAAVCRKLLVTTPVSGTGTIYMNKTNDTFQSAYLIADAILDSTAEAALTHDFAKFEPNFALPWVFENFEGKRRVATRDELRAYFEDLCVSTEAAGVTHMIQRTTEAEYVSETVFYFTYVCRMLNKATLVCEPVPCFAEVHLKGGEWRMVRTCTALPGTGTFGRLFND